MKVKIVHNSEKLFNVNVTEKTTVRDLKQTISRRIGMPPEDQVLTLREIFLEDMHPLGDYRLPKPDVVVPIDLYLRANYKKPTPIRVALSADKILPLSICLDAKVSELRSVIEEKMTISPKKSSDIRLIYNHLILEDNEVLERYGIKKNSCVIVARRLARSQTQDTFPGIAEKPSQKLSEANVVAPEIKLNIIKQDGETLVFSFMKKMTLREASEQIEKETGIPAAHQVLSLQEGLPYVADLAKSLEDLGLNDRDTIYLKDARFTNSHDYDNVSHSPNSTDMLLIFKDKQNTFPISIPQEGTVQDGIDALRKAINGTPGPLWLKNPVDGKYMQDYDTPLSDLGVTNGMTIEYVYLPAKTEWASN